MRIVQPSYEIECFPESTLADIERFGRVCYKSEKRITKKSAEKFVKMITKRGHWSVIEHKSASVRFIVDRGVSHELVRHRIASFSQECVVGSTKVHKKYTIKDLYDRESTCYGKTHNKTLHLNSVGKDNVLIRNKIKNIFYKGVQPVFKVTTSRGYQIICTENHRFLCLDGEFSVLGDLEVGDQVLVNGRSCLLRIDDEILEDEYRSLSPQEIADKHGAPYRSVLDRLHRLGIFEKHKNDKNKEKYQRNHTEETLEKARRTNQAQYDSGRVVWNKGLTEYDHPSVASQGDSLRKNHHNNGEGEENSNWKGGVSRSYGVNRLREKFICAICGDPGEEVHHIDEDPKNNFDDNLVKLCVHCHSVAHHGWHVGKKAVSDVIVSIEPVGEESTYDIEMKAPYHNYVADGFVVHNSSRYCNYSGEVAFVEVPFWEHQSTLYKLWFSHMEECEEVYTKMIEEGAKPEEARSVLPNSLKTELIVTANMREWAHIFSLRAAQPAHPQMRQVMIPLAREFCERLPEIYGSILDSLGFSSEG